MKGSAPSGGALIIGVSPTVKLGTDVAAAPRKASADKRRANNFSAKSRPHSCDIYNSPGAHCNLTNDGANEEDQEVRAP